ncbi:ABC transporter ATP-binding protein [Microbacterium sp. NPDC055357]
MTTDLKTTGASLDLVGLSKHYGDFAAASDVSLSIQPGEFITFLGPSGSGKTTTLSMIAGFISPDSGTIDMDGSGILKLAPHKRDLGVVFQNYALFPTMTVFDNIAFPLRARRAAKDEVAKKVAAVLELVGLDHLGARYPKELSGGQQQRVAFARAIVFSPRVLLMDEPLGALDKRLRERLQVEIRRLHRELGITFVYVTHDQDEALALSDRIAVFNEGRIEQVGTPEVMYSRPATPFVASFIGESNMLDAVVDHVDGDTLRARTDFATFELDSRRTPRLDVGDPISVLIRPEKITAALTEGPGSFDILVSETLFLGTHYRVRGTTTTGQTILVDGAVAAGLLPSEGDRFRVRFDPAEAHVLVREPATEGAAR